MVIAFPMPAPLFVLPGYLRLAADHPFPPPDPPNPRTGVCARRELRNAIADRGGTATAGLELTRNDDAKKPPPNEGKSIFMFVFRTLHAARQVSHLAEPRFGATVFSNHSGRRRHLVAMDRRPDPDQRFSGCRRLKR